MTLIQNYLLHLLFIIIIYEKNNVFKIFIRKHVFIKKEIIFKT